MFDLVEQQKKLSEVVQKTFAGVDSIDWLKGGITYDNYLKKVPPVIPTVAVKEGAMTEILKSVVENQQAQLQALQEQKRMTEEELALMEKQLTEAKASARSSRRWAVGSLLVAIASLIYSVWPGIWAWLGPLFSGG